MMYALAIIMGFMDAARGGFFIKQVRPALAMLVYGAAVAVLSGVTGLAILAVVLAFRVGESFGWGTPLGAALDNRQMVGDFEWWQFSVFKRNAYAALGLRGFMWGAPMALLAPWVSPVLYSLPVVYAVAMPLAVYLAQRFPQKFVEPWATQEFLRGWVVGFTLLIIA